MIKQHVVRVISWDIFRIMSDGIYFSSLAILKTSDGILFPTDKIWEISEKFGEESETIKKKLEKTGENSLVSKFENGKEETFLRV